VHVCVYTAALYPCMRLVGSHTNDAKLGCCFCTVFTQLGHIAHKYGRNISDIISTLVPPEQMSRLEERTFSELVYNCQCYTVELPLTCKCSMQMWTGATVVRTDSSLATITFITNYSAIRQAIATGNAFQYNSDAI
jgi:hypothetical protein